MVIIGITNLVVAFILGIYSGLSLHLPYMKSRFFKRFPVASFYNKAVLALSKFNNPSLNKREYYDDALGKPYEYRSEITSLNEGFNEIVRISKASKLITQPIDCIELVKVVQSDGQNEVIKIHFKTGSKVIKTIDSIEKLEDVLQMYIQSRFAIISIVLTVLLGILGFTLIVLGVQSQ